MPNPKKDPDEGFLTKSFPSAAAFSSFLQTNSTTLPGLYLHLAKKSSGIHSITGAEAVEEALCNGWIDGRANTVDEKWYSIRFTPRRAKSIWSKKNVFTVEKLIEQGRMRKEGLRCVNEAKGDGRWERAYEGPKSMVVPRDFEMRLGEDEVAKGFWDGLNRGQRYSVLWRIETASVKAREGVIERMLGMLGRGEVPGEVVKKETSSNNAKSKVQTKVDKGGVGKKGTKRTPVGTSTVSKKKLDMLEAVVENQPRESRRAGLRSRG